MRLIRMLDVAAPEYLLTFAVALLLFVVGDAPFFADGDTAWHLAAGELIRLSGRIPDQDHWTLLAESQPWYNLSWLYDVLISVLRYIGGMWLLYLVHFAAAVAMVLVLLRRCLSRGVGLFASFTAVFLAMLVLYPSLMVRPQMVTYLFIMVFVHLLDDFHHTRRRQPLVLMPLLMLLWVNMHGGFVLGLVLMGLHLLQLLLDGQKALAKMLGISLGAALVACCITPWGWHLPAAMMATLGSPITPFIGEWAPLDVMRHPSLALYILLFLAVVDFTGKRALLADKLFAVLLLFMSVASMRHGPELALVTAPYLAVSLHKALAASRWSQVLRLREKSYRWDISLPAARRVFFALALALMALAVIPGARNMLGLREGFARQAWPEAEVAFLNEQYPGARLFNHYDMGGALAYLASGQPRYFIDGRAGTALPEKVLTDYIRMMRLFEAGEMPQKLMDAYQFDAALIPNDYFTLRLFESASGWGKIYKGPVATVFARQE